MAAFGLPLLMTACATRRPTEHSSIRNFHEAFPGSRVYRGGNPNNTAAWQHLQKLGVKRIVKLNTLRAAEEPVTAKQYGIAVVSAPIDGTGMWIAGPGWTTMNTAVSSIVPGTFVHCQHGQDRTGLVIAAWQVQMLGRSKREAWNDMVTRGFRPMPGLMLWWLFAVHPRPAP